MLHPVSSPFCFSCLKTKFGEKNHREKMKTPCSTFCLIRVRGERGRKRPECGGDGGRWVEVVRGCWDCIQLLWCDKEVCYGHVTLFPLITLLTCTVLIGADLSTRSSCINVKPIIVSWASTSHTSLSCALMLRILSVYTCIIQHKTHLGHQKYVESRLFTAQ